MHQTVNHLRFPNFGLNGENGLRGLSHVCQYGLCLERIYHDDPNRIQPVYGRAGRPGHGDSPNAIIRHSAWGRVRDLGRETGAQPTAESLAGKLIYVKPFALSIRILALLGALVVGSVANAQSVPASGAGNGYQMTVVGNAATAGPTLTNVGNFAKISYEAGALGGIKNTGKASFKMPTGAVVAVDVVAKVSHADTAAALGRFAKKALPFLGTGVALYDLAKELNMVASTDSAGVPVFQKQDSAVCSVAPCYDYKIVNQRTNLTSPYLRSLGEVCTWYGQNMGPALPIPTYTCQWYQPPNGVPRVPYITTSTGAGDVGSARSIAPLPPVFTSATVEEFAAAVGNKTMWLPSSALARAVVDAVKAGEELRSVPESITGPATTPGGATVTSDGVNTTTTTTTNNHTYGGTTVTTTTNSSTSVTNISTGATTVTNNASTTTPLPEDPKDPCIENPQRLGCMTGGTPETVKLTKETQAVTVTPVSFGSAAGCPAALSFSVMSHTYAISYQPLCDRLIILKALFLAMAGFMAAYVLADSFKVT